VNRVKILSILLLSLILPQTLLGLWTVTELAPAFSFEATSEPVQFVVVGSEPVIEREKWWLEVQYPVDDYTNTTSGYGYRSIEGCNRCSEFHKGLDFTPGVGSPVYAIMDGVVSQVNHSGQYGVHVILTHTVHEDLAYTTVYAHLQVSQATKRLQLDNNIKKGDLLGYVGNTGLSTGPHLHFEVLKNGRNLNPAAFFNEHIRNE
jgi:murein DD-endopeptidase MepM/ murein hydrolase activator NlpD